MLVRKRTIEKKHPLDIATFFVACFAFMTATAAAWYTHDQVMVSKDTEERQLRAYVGLDSVNLDLRGGGVVAPSSEAGSAGATRFTNDYFLPSVKNYGLTPARDVQIRWQLLYSLSGLPENLKFGDPHDVTNPDFVSRATLNAGQTGIAESPLTVRNDMLARKAVSSGATIYFFGTLTYADVFGENWIDHFCFMLDRADTAGHAFIPCGRYNDEARLN